MKQLLPALFVSISILNPLVGSAQISLLSSDLTQVGDVITRYGDTIPTYGPGSAGVSQTWDFSSAVNDTTSTTTVVTVASTSFSSTFNSSNYAMTGGADSYLFFTHDANSMTTTGAAGDLLGTGQQIESPFSDPLLLHQFPRTYGSHFDDTYAFITEADGAGIPTPIPVNRVKLTHNGHVYDTTDAYGTLITPTGTYDALRVKSVDFTTDILEYKLFAFSQWTVLSTTVDTSVTYSWHAKEEMLAIAEYTFDSIGNPKQFTYSSVPPVVTVGIDDNSPSQSVSVYPQPASSQLCVKGLSVSGNNQADIFGLDGKLIESVRFDGSCLNTEKLSSGMYILQLTSIEGLRHKPLKFIIE
ncbi:MAG: T9SS type A sorting domain-containing protein [Flavobacteriales bacterium]|nr:T9SS type A sorting domain-containing protein [Flavobacteriales bacterium]